MEDLLIELKKFKIKYPGTSDPVPLSKHEELIKFAEPYFEKWREGKSVSVPPVRVPPPCHFIRGPGLTTSRRKRLRTRTTGECGEIGVYRTLLGLNKSNTAGSTTKGNNGMFVIPNFNGDKKFDCHPGKVEIDFIVIHVLKGVFVLNVKNAQNVILKDICNEMKRHKDFLAALRDFDKSEGDIFPLNDIVISLKQDLNSKKGILSNRLKNLFSEHFSGDKQYVFNPNGAQELDAYLQQVIDESLTLTDDQKKCLDVFATRLIALSSIESSIPDLHRKMVNNEFQFIKTKKSGSNEEQTGNISDYTVANFELYQVDEKFSILWTIEQARAFSIFSEKVREYLSSDSQKGFRLLVYGPKGSGKTVLLFHFAQMAKSMLKNEQNADRKPKVVVCDGRMGQSVLLLDHLRTKLSAIGVEVLSGCFQKENLQNADLVLVDEFLCFLGDRVIRKIGSSQNCVIFSADNSFSLFDGSAKVKTSPSDGSAKVKTSLATSFDRVNLTASLRANLGITRFVESFRLQSDSQNFNFDAFKSKIGQISCCLGHNLEGQPPDIKIQCYSDAEYVEKAAKTIHEKVSRSIGLESILVVVYLHPVTISRIIDQLELKNLDYEYRSPVDILCSQSKTSNDANTNEEYSNETAREPKLPKVVFYTSQQVDGAEFGSVVVLLERSLPQSWNEFLFDRLFGSFTRATIDLSIVVNDSKLAPLLFDDKESQASAESSGHLHSSTSLEEYTRRAYEWLTATDSSLEEQIMLILERCAHVSKDPVIFVGKLPDNSGLVPCEYSSEVGFPERLGEKFKWFKFGQSYVGELDKPSTFRLVTHLSVKFSTLILVAKSKNDYFLIHQNISYFILLYQMHQKKLRNNPIYFITTFETSKGDTEINRVCQFLSDWSKGKIQDHRSGQKLEKKSPQPDARQIEQNENTLKRVSIGRIVTPAYWLRDCFETLEQKYHFQNAEEAGITAAGEDDRLSVMNYGTRRQITSKLADQATELADMFLEASNLDKSREDIFLSEHKKYSDKALKWKTSYDNIL